jgi:hypothetical protein
VRSFEEAIGPTFGDDYGTDLGTKLGLAHGGGKLFASWVDTSAGNVNTGRQDVNFASVDLPSSSGRTLVLGAGLVALLGGSLFVLAVSRRNRGGPSTPIDAQNRQVVSS